MSAATHAVCGALARRPAGWHPSAHNSSTLDSMHKQTLSCQIGPQSLTENCHEQRGTADCRLYPVAKFPGMHSDCFQCDI